MASTNTQEINTLNSLNSLNTLNSLNSLNTLNSLNCLNTLNTLHNKSLKIAKLEHSETPQSSDVKMVPLIRITREQFGEFIAFSQQLSRQAAEKEEKIEVSSPCIETSNFYKMGNNIENIKPKTIPLKKTDDVRYCSYCGVECPYNATRRKYSMNCYTCSRTRYLPPLYCNICGRKGNGMLINYLDICCDPAVTKSDCLQYSKENPYN